MGILGETRFDQCVIAMALINLCNQESYVGQEMRQRYNAWKADNDEAVNNPWHDLHQFTIYVPHPDQQYEGITLAEGLTLGYNLEVKPVEGPETVPYQIPQGGHFVVVMKQKGVDQGFAIAATGVFVRSLGVLSLDIITDLEKGETQPLVICHSIIRDYPAGWEEKLKLFMQREIREEALPNLVRHVDRALNQDYRSPSWQEVYLTATGFAGV